MNKTAWGLATAFWLLAAIPAAAAAALSVMIFDAPGSTNSRLTVALFVSMVAMPVSCLFGAGIPWLFRSKPFGKWLFLLPLLNVAIVVVIVAAIEQFCGGSFVCR